MRSLVTKLTIPVLLAGLMFLAGVVGCGEESPTTREPELLVLDHVPGADMQVEYNLLVFLEQGNESLLELQEGTYLISTQGQGFIRQVIRPPYREGPLLFIETLPAQLTDVVDAAHVQITNQEWDPEEDSPSWVRLWRLPGFHLSFQDTTLIDTTTQSGNHLELTATTGGIDFDPSVDFDLSVDWGSLEHFLVYVDGNLHAELGIHLEASGCIRPKLELFTRSISLYRQEKNFVFWAGWVPIVVTVDLDFGLGARVEVEGQVTADLAVDTDAFISAGAEYRGGDWYNLSDVDVDVALEKDLQGTGRLHSLRVYPVVAVGFKLYDTAGPAVSIDPYIQYSWEPGKNWQAGIRGSFRFQLQVPIWDRPFSAWRKTLFDCYRDFANDRFGCDLWEDHM